MGLLVYRIACQYRWTWHDVGSRMVWDTHYPERTLMTYLTPPDKLLHNSLQQSGTVPQLIVSLPRLGGGWSANHTPGRVKTSLSKSGNDQFFDMKNFDETSRRIRWSENEFSHSLALQRTAAGRCCCNRRASWPPSLLGR